MSQVVTWRSG